MWETTPTNISYIWGLGWISSKGGGRAQIAPLQLCAFSCISYTKRQTFCASDPGMISFSKVKMVGSLKTHNITKEMLCKEEPFARFWTAFPCIQDCEQHLQEAQNIFRDVQHWRGEASTWPTFSTMKKKGSENNVKKLVGSFKGAKWTAFFWLFCQKSENAEGWGVEMLKPWPKNLIQKCIRSMSHCPSKFAAVHFCIFGSYSFKDCVTFMWTLVSLCSIYKIINGLILYLFWGGWTQI